MTVARHCEYHGISSSDLGKKKGGGFWGLATWRRCLVLFFQVLAEFMHCDVGSSETAVSWSKLEAESGGERIEGEEFNIFFCRNPMESPDTSKCEFDINFIIFFRIWSWRFHPFWFVWRLLSWGTELKMFVVTPYSRTLVEHGLVGSCDGVSVGDAAKKQVHWSNHTHPDIQQPIKS